MHCEWINSVIIVILSDHYHNYYGLGVKKINKGVKFILPCSGCSYSAFVATVTLSAPMHACMNVLYE